jgi:hypothetical protein
VSGSLVKDSTSLDVLIKGGRQIAVPSFVVSERNNTMDYKVKLNWQEDEFASRGTTYFVEFLKMDDTSLGEVDGNSWQEVFTKAVNYLQEIGEI